MCTCTAHLCPTAAARGAHPQCVHGDAERTQPSSACTAAVGTLRAQTGAVTQPCTPAQTPGDLPCLCTLLFICHSCAPAPKRTPKPRVFLPLSARGGLTYPPPPPPRSPPGGTALGTDGAVTSAPRATGTHCGQRPRRWRRSRARWAAVRLRERWCCCCPSRCCWPSAGPGTASPAHASEWPRRCPVGRDGGSDAKT